MEHTTEQAPRVTQNARIAWQVYDGEAVLVDPEGAVCMVLNETATLIWDQCAVPRSAAELAAALAAAYEGDPREMAADVRAIVAAFLAKGVLKEA
jgi:hypothetical protein